MSASLHHAFLIAALAPIKEKMQTGKILYASNQFQDRLEALWLSCCFVLFDCCMYTVGSNYRFWAERNPFTVYIALWIFHHVCLLCGCFLLPSIFHQTHTSDISDPVNIFLGRSWAHSACGVTGSKMIWVSAWEQNICVWTTHTATYFTFTIMEIPIKVAILKHY